MNAVERALGGARWTPLHFAAIYKAGPEVVALLLARGADVHAVDKDKRTALHSAATNQASADVVELLSQRAPRPVESTCEMWRQEKSTRF